jgi:hypothetical protein
MNALKTFAMTRSGFESESRSPAAMPNGNIPAWNLIGDWKVPSPLPSNIEMEDSA